MNSVTEVHATLDEILALLKQKAKAEGHPVTCGAGCSACCSEPVYVERSEVMHMLEGLSEEELTVLKVKTQRWLKHIRKTNLLNEELPHVLKYRAAKLVCPFLKNNLCSVYERRPAACREHMVIGKPKLCFDERTRLKQKFVDCTEVNSYFIRNMVEVLFKDLTMLTFDHLACHLAAILLNDEVADSKAKSQIKIG